MLLVSKRRLYQLPACNFFIDGHIEKYVLNKIIDRDEFYNYCYH